MSRDEPGRALPPAGMRVALDESVRRMSGDTVLFGGTASRLIRLNDKGARRVGAWLAGAGVADDPADRGLARRLLDAGMLHPRADAPRLGTRDVTVVVPLKDNAAGAARVVGATVETRKQVVVDDGSRTPSPDATIRHGRTRGAAAARNTGWRVTDTELVAFLDADVTPERGWLDALLPLFNDPEVVAAAPRVRATEGRGAIARYERGRCPLDMGRRPAVVRAMSTVSYVPSAALVVRRSALKEVDGFDERLRFGEDVDLVWRLVARCGTVRYEPRATVRHTSRPNLRHWLRQHFDYGTSAAALADRHQGSLSPAYVPVACGAAWIAAAAQRPGPAVALSAVAWPHLFRKLRHTGMPTRQACAVAGQAHLSAGRALAEATRRVWWPLALLGNRGRWALLAAYLPALLSTYVGRERAPATVSTIALRVADDVAYGTGVWTGCLRRRTFRPLVPTVLRS